MQVVIIGAGYAGLTTALRLARSRYVGRVILINERPEHQLMTQLHKVAAGALQPEFVLLSLERLLKGTAVELLIGRVSGIDPERNRVLLEDGATVAYDRLVVALGSQLETFGVPGVFEYALHVQPLDQALRIRDHIAARVEYAATVTGPERTHALRFAIVGGGLTGVELAGELADQLPTTARALGIDSSEIAITLMEAGPRLLPGLATELADEAALVLQRKGIDVRTNTAIKAITPDGVMVNDVSAATIRADRLEPVVPEQEQDHDPGFWPTDTVIWTAGVRGHRLTEAAFQSGARGRALVDEYLRAIDYPNVYILGDNALAVSRGNEQAAAPTAQNAVQQAAIVADNIIAEAQESVSYRAARKPSHGASTGVAVETKRDTVTTDAAAEAQSDAVTTDDVASTRPDLMHDVGRTPYIARPLGIFVSVGRGEAVGELAFGDYWRPRLSGMPAYAFKWASEQRYKLGIGASLGA